MAAGVEKIDDVIPMPYNQRDEERNKNLFKLLSCVKCAHTIINTHLHNIQNYETAKISTVIVVQWNQKFKWVEVCTKFSLRAASRPRSPSRCEGRPLGALLQLQSPARHPLYGPTSRRREGGDILMKICSC